MLVPPEAALMDCEIDDRPSLTSSRNFLRSVDSTEGEEDWWNERLCSSTESAIVHERRFPGRFGGDVPQVKDFQACAVGHF